MVHVMPGYRLDEKNRVISRLFDSDKFPPGWVDSPAKLAAKPAGAPIAKPMPADFGDAVPMRSFNEPKRRETLRIPRK